MKRTLVILSVVSVLLAAGASWFEAGRPCAGHRYAVRADGER